MSSRRSTLRAGGALLAAAGGLALPRSVFAQSTPVTEGAGLLLVQSFSHGSLFPTQGEAGLLPYTLILWDAAARGLFFTSAADQAAGFAPTEALLLAIAAGERPRAAVVVPESPGVQRVWTIRLAYGGLGSDPDAVTYQGEAMDEAEAADWLGMTPEPLRHEVEDLSAGYLIVGGLPALDLPEGNLVRIALGR
jgi:hypothetical protein